MKIRAGAFARDFGATRDNGTEDSTLVSDFISRRHEPPNIESIIGRLAISVRGVVQGVGFRPFVYNSARAKGLCGWVLNQADAVRMEVQGERAALDEFVESFRNAHPPQARIDQIEIREVPCEKDSPATFEIRASAR